MSRLVLPDASENYYLFNLKVDHIEMLSRSGYVIDDDELAYSVVNPDMIDDRIRRFGAFVRKYADADGNVQRHSLDRIYNPKKSDRVKPVAKVSFTHKQVVKAIKNQEYREAMENPQSSNYVIIQITKEKPSDDAKSKQHDKINFIYYLDRQITFDVTDHAFSTKLMKKLSPQEAEKFYGQPGMSGKSLKAILVTDPLAIVNGWKIGDVIQSYRETVVINPPRSHISYSVVTRQPPPKQKSSNDVLDPAENI